jgi:serine protease Do
MKPAKLVCLALLGFSLQTLSAQVCARGSVYQIAVMRANGNRAVGSAVQIAAGKLIANCHTVREASLIFVMHPEKRFSATLERADFLHDLCLLRVPALNGASPSRVRSADLRVGQAVIAFGYGSGFGLSVTRGAITALHRLDHGRVLRTSARFPNGASGGGLFDEEGRLVGILTFRAGQNEALNYAVPMEWVERLLDDPSAPDALPATAAFWEDRSPAQPAFLRAARMEHEGAWQELRALATHWATAQADDVEAWLALGRAEAGLRRTKEAVVALQRAAALQPNNSRVWYWLAIAYHSIGAVPQFEDASNRLAELDTELGTQLRGELQNSPGETPRD